jgi:1,4-alpha-glucan branching enzyme
LRAYYGFMWGYPGKKLLFMGQEFAQRREWSESRSLDWNLLDAPAHAGMKKLIADLNRLYRETPALHARDCEGDGFEWLIVDDAANSVYAWLRKPGDGQPPVAVVTNFTPVPRDNYRLPLPKAGRWRELLNTDAADYGGSGRGNLGAIAAQGEPSHGQPASAAISLPPMATLMFEYTDS